MAIQAYPEGKLKLFAGLSTNKSALFSSVLVGASALKALLIRQGGAFDVNDLTVANVVSGGVEMTGGGYTREVLTNVAVTKSGSSVYMTSDPIVFSTLAIGNTVVALVIYAEDPAVGSDATSIPLGWFDGGSYPFEVPKATNGGDFTCNPHPIEGWFKAA